ncbi:MAG: hypothetical protein B7X10_06505, partial [Burkholderiales bacterium 21-58-4]
VGTPTTLSLASNSVNATVTGNSANSQVSGVIPVSYTSTNAVGGSLTSTSGSGNIVVASNQSNTGTGASASTLLNDTALLSVTSTGTGAQTVGLNTSETGNSLGSTFTGNTASNGINIVSTNGVTTGQGALNGSLVVANVQSNAPTGGFSASNTGSAVQTAIVGGTGAPINFTGSSTQTGNSISASATGNSTGSGVGSGNFITLGVNLTGVNQGAPDNVTTGATPSLNQTGDLIVGNNQSNTNLTLASSVTGGVITTVIDGTTGATVTTNANSVSSAAQGNTAANGIVSSGTLNNISGLAALASLQTQTGGSDTATSSTNAITATAGNATLAEGVSGST